MSASTPSALPSFLGGAGLALSAHSLLALNGSVFGISGFVHRAARGSHEGIAAVLAFLLGGFVVGKLDGPGPAFVDRSFGNIALSGFLVGLGTKLGNGCTSGHMLCGMSRFSKRSIAATLTFFATGAFTTRLLHGSLPAVSSALQTTLGHYDTVLLAGAALSLSAAWLFSLSSSFETSAESPSHRRIAVQVLTGLSFAFSLRVTQLVEPLRVLGFLVLPGSSAFDPSLFFLALGAMPLLSTLYHTGTKRIDVSSPIDIKLLVGAAIFGVGWGIEGICPGPGLVNFGQALATGSGITETALWLGTLAAGGLLV
ncbi:DUF395-domain-containing protein [Exidia glandulosa HHB12029]|uniref:DUF395-domain-containing protein n=1 Tax=Exidia glandulosa HHB12029 TaxID=1314781 RepID=A0A165R2H5_EXIGL|nr:DUF395-domain-containing protein [Exidia glandulosa HHB12029]